MNGFDRRREGSAESGNVELAPAPGASSSKWTLRWSFVGTSTVCWREKLSRATPGSVNIDSEKG
jgi:hypothetical protein